MRPSGEAPAGDERPGLRITAASLALAAPQLVAAALDLGVADRDFLCVCDSDDDRPVDLCGMCRLRVGAAIAEGLLTPNAPPVPDGKGGYGCCDHEGPHGRCDFISPEHLGEHACVLEDGTVHVWCDDDEAALRTELAMTCCRCGEAPPPVAP